jgi:hypothetical protein
MLYQIQAELVLHEDIDDPNLRSRSVPTFYLNPRVQGILNADHAKVIAEEIIMQAVLNPETIASVSIIVTEVD